MAKTVLIIDDEKLVRESLARLLSGPDLTVLEAVDGQDGLNKALAAHPDLIVTDLKMPQMDGQTMLDKLRADEWGKQVPVIIMSSDDSTASINQALAAGVTVYLSKSSLEPKDVIEQIKAALG